MPIIQHLTNSAGGGSGTDINLLLKGRWGTDASVGATVSNYWSSATANNYSGQKSNTFVEGDFTRVGDGILSFLLPAATYKIYAKSGHGSGNYSWNGMSTEANLTLSSDTDVLLLIPNHGVGSYSGGGGFYLIAGTDYTSASNTALLILGGGGGGYSSQNDWGKPGALSTALSQTRRGPSNATNGDYDGGASWKNEYTPETYSSGYQAYAARNFVQGGKGGTVGACGPVAGFGGGGGSCPGGGGGLQGGYPGTNSHNGGSGYGGSQSWSGGQMGGGGGTSYYNSSYITNLSNTNYGSSNTAGYSTEQVAHNGYFGIYTV